MEQESTSFWADIKRHEDILAKEPDSYCFAQLAELYRELGLIDDAINVAKRGCKIHQEYVNGHMALARAYLDKGLKGEAKAAFEKVVRATPDNLQAQKLLSRIYIDEGNTEAAIKTFRNTLSLNPDDIESKAMLDSLSKISRTADERLNKPPETLIQTEETEDTTVMSETLLDDSLFEEVEVIEELYEEVLLDIELTYSETSTASPAFEFGDQEVFLDETKDSLATMTLADLYISQGFPKRAIAVYRELLRTEPENFMLKQRLIDLKVAIDLDDSTARNHPTPSVEKRTTETPHVAIENTANELVSNFPQAKTSEDLSSISILDSMTCQANTTDTRNQALDTLNMWLANIRRMKQCHSKEF